MNIPIKLLLINGAKLGLGYLDKRLDDILESDNREALKREIIEELKGEIDGRKTEER